MSFSDLKKQSKLGSLTQKLVKEVEKSSAGTGVDDRIWKPQLDKSGNGYAVIRFLPAPDGEDLPWAKVYNHAFQGPGGWLIDSCLTSIGGKCPVCESNSELWNSGSDANKDLARTRKRKLSYYSNIYVVKDPSSPENEGKLFLFKYGKKIFDKIMAAMQPEFEDETPINPFDFWEGADFKLKIKKVAGYWNYDSSEFTSPSPLLEGDDESLESLWKKQYSLNEFVNPENFKSYDELKKRLDYVLGVRGSSKTEDRETMEEEQSWESERRGETVSSMPESIVDSKDDGEDDDTLSYFQKLAEA